MSYSNVIAEDQRLTILRALEEDPDYAHNEHILAQVLASLGHASGRDLLRTQLAWLAEQGLVTIEHVGEVQVAKLTARGEDAALGRVRVPGVARPRLP